MAKSSEGIDRRHLTARKIITNAGPPREDIDLST